MLSGSLHLVFARDDDRYVARVTRALGRRRIAAAAMGALLLSFGPLLSSELLDFLTPVQAAQAWFAHFIELAAVAAALVAVYTLLDEALPGHLRFRLVALCLLLLGSSVVLAILLHAYFAQGFDHLPPPARVFADSLRWGLPAVFLALFADVHQRALQADVAAGAEELARAQLRQGESEQRLALLQAQLEPHFLFNMLGNVRRLYRTRPQAGAEAVDSLARYLRMALPRVRSETGCLGDEIELVRAYLELFSVRMGVRLTFSIEIDPALHAAEFPPMLLMTLVENAIRHGLEPVGGGHVAVHAAARDGLLEVGVLDDGAGFGAAAGSGTGVGLVNVQRQLLARYPGRASLTLQQREPHGASATLTLPWRMASARQGRDSNQDVPSTTGARAPARSSESPATEAKWWTSLRHGLHMHLGAVAMAGVLSIAVPATFLVGDLGVMGQASAGDLAALTLWWLLYGIELWILLLALAFASRRFKAPASARACHALWLLAACVAAALPTLSTAARARILVQDGVVRSAATMHVYTFMFALTMALLYVAHLRRGLSHEAAAKRLAAAQAAQRDARHGMMLSRLQALQARIDPQLLFEMLGAVRRSYEADAASAEGLLDELIRFLRSALPRVQSASSSVPREAELARAYARLRMRAGATDASMTVELSAQAMHARLQPGILLPLLDDTLRRRSGPCGLTATRSGDECRVVLSMPVRPSDEVLARVRSLLFEVHGASADLTVEETEDAVTATARVPYEPA